MFYQNMVIKMLKCKNEILMTSHFGTLYIYILDAVLGLYKRVCDLHVVRQGNANSIQNSCIVTNLTMEPFCILLPLTLPYRTMCKFANSISII